MHIFITAEFLSDERYSYRYLPFKRFDSHLKELEQHGIKVCSLNDGMCEENDLAASKYSIIFTNPESLVLNKKWHTMVQNKVYQESLFGIVADKVHVVLKW